MSVDAYNLFFVALAFVAAFAALAILFPPSRRWLRSSGFIEIAPGLALVVAVFSTAGSLGYSEIWDYEPCRLCWFQRICMYPLVWITAVGVFRRDQRNLMWYGTPIALVGGLISIYHYMQQVWPELGSDACAVGVPCTAKYVNELGFVSIPLMALTGFALIAALLTFRPQTTTQTEAEPLELEESDQ